MTSWYSSSGWWEVIASVVSLGFAYWLGRHQQSKADEAAHRRDQAREAKARKEAHGQYRDLLSHLSVLARRIGTELGRVLERWDGPEDDQEPVLEEAPFLMAEAGWNAMSPRLVSHGHDIELHAALAYFFADIAAAHVEFQRLRDLEQQDALDSDIYADTSRYYIDQQRRLLQRELGRLAATASRWADDLHNRWKEQLHTAAR